jgi:hypothetical protein
MASAQGGRDAGFVNRFLDEIRKVPLKRTNINTVHNAYSTAAGDDLKAHVRKTLASPPDERARWRVDFPKEVFEREQRLRRRFGEKRRTEARRMRKAGWAGLLREGSPSAFSAEAPNS